MDIMEKGKGKCKILKDIRSYIAEKYGLSYNSLTCSHQDDCLGTCTQSNVELAYILRRLESMGITDIRQDETLSKMVSNYVSNLSIPELLRECALGIIAPSNYIIDTEGDIKAPEEDITMQEVEPQFQRRAILKCAVAGIGFHDINDIWDELYVGAKLALVRERNNKYDKNAVAIACTGDYDGNPDDFDFNFILGYIPRAQNHTIAAMLDMGWENLLEAEISEMKDHAPYNDRLHITVYIRSKEPVEPKDDRLRIMYFDNEGEWKDFTDVIWEKGYSHYRWGGCPPWEPDLPDKGDKVVFIHKKEQKTTLYLMMAIATGDGCAPYVDDEEELHMVDNCTSYVLTVVKGPVKVNTDELTFLSRDLTERWQPDFKLEKQASDALLKIIQDYLAG